MASSATVPSPDGSYYVVQQLTRSRNGRDTVVSCREKGGDSVRVETLEIDRESDWVSRKRGVAYRRSSRDWPEASESAGIGSCRRWCRSLVRRKEAPSGTMVVPEGRGDGEDAGGVTACGNRRREVAHAAERRARRA